MGNEHNQDQQKDNHEPASAEKSAAQAKTPSPLPSYYPPQRLSVFGAASPDDIPLTRDNLLLLQRTIGNQTVAQLLQRKGKLSQPGDEYEREADRVAEQVVERQPERLERVTGPLPIFCVPIGAGPTMRGGITDVSNECADCRAKQQPVQRQATGMSDQLSLPSSVTAVIQSSGGEALPESTREHMESALESNLGDVRIHTGSQAAHAAHDISARAFTIGQDIYFGAGQYQPNAQQGQRLLAHELTHTIQQTSGRSALQTNAIISQPDDSLEREAESVAETVGRVSRSTASSEQPVPSQPQLATRPMVQRAWYDAITEGAEWVGGQIASGAEAAWEGTKWVGGQIASGAEAAWGEMKRVGGAAIECAKTAGRSIMNIFSPNAGSLQDMLGIAKPSGENAPGILNSIVSVAQHPCLQMVPGYTLLAGAVGQLRGVRDFLAGAWRVMQNPDIILDAIRASLGGMIAKIPDQARSLARNAITFSDPPEGHLEGIWRHLEPKLTYLADNWWEVLKETGQDMLWPWPGVGKDLGEIWEHIKAGASDLWDLKINSTVDHLLAVWRTVNNMLGRLYGWFFIASVLVGAILGAVFGGGVGAIPGAAAGASFALTVGQFLLISMVAAETASIAKAGYDLVFTEQTDEAKEKDYEQIANSGLVLGITGVMYGIGVVAARFARAIINRVAGRVWGRPALRGRGTTSRGDVIEIRVATAARVIGLLRRRAVTWLESIRRDFPVIDLVEGGQINITPRPGRAPLYQVNGGRLISVKSTGLIGADAQGAIQAWIDQLANFTSVKNVSVVNPSGRTLMVAVQTPLDDATAAAVRTYASGRGVTVEMFTNLPPNHPAVVFPDAIPAIMGEAGVVAADEAKDSEE